MAAAHFSSFLDRTRPPAPARPSLVPPSPVPFLPVADASLIDRIPIRSDTILATGFVVVQKRRPLILSIGAASGRKINDAICYGAARPANASPSTVRWGGRRSQNYSELRRRRIRVVRVLREEMEDLWVRRGIRLPYIVLLHCQPFL